MKKYIALSIALLISASSTSYATQFFLRHPNVKIVVKGATGCLIGAVCGDFAGDVVFPHMPKIVPLIDSKARLRILVTKDDFDITGNDNGERAAKKVLLASQTVGGLAAAAKAMGKPGAIAFGAMHCCHLINLYRNGKKLVQQEEASNQPDNIRELTEMLTKANREQDKQSKKDGSSN